MVIGSNLFNTNTHTEPQNIFHAINHSAIISFTNAVGDITYVNDKFCKISQFSRDELIGKNHRMLKSGDHSERFYNEMWSAISSGHIWSGEIKNRAKDGSVYWVSTTIAPSLYKEEDPHKYVSIGFDISEKKLLEEKVSKLKIDFHQALVEREAQEQFLSTLSHDIRTPLTIAKISAQIIEKKHPVTEKIKNLITKITNNINRVDTLVTELLDASKHRIPQNFSLDFAEFDMLDMVLETLENLRTMYGERFEVEASGNLKGHWCLSSIKRILENLASNAIKYGNAETPVVIKIADKDNQLVLSVHNYGNPISEIDQKVIFDYLQRTPSSEISGQNGWGLGLSIVKEMAQVHGGTVEVLSFPGNEGTTFMVTLPKDARPFLA